MDVYYEGSFWDHRQNETLCRPVPVGCQFEWKGYMWMIPAVYVCRQGFAVDLLRRVPLPEVEAFAERWKGRKDINHELAEYENPLCCRFSMEIHADGARIRRTRVCGTCWHPFEYSGRSASRDSGELMEAYHCSRDYGWDFSRGFYQWDFEQLPGNVRLELELKPEKYLVPCPEHFTVTEQQIGETVEFTHPFTGTPHSLVICGVTQELLPKEAFEENEHFTYPRCFQRLQYQMEEDLYGQFTLRDCSQGDAPKKKRETEDGRTTLSCSVAAVGIIMDGESGSKDPGAREAFSALHFEPVEQVEWRIDASILAGEKYAMSLDIDIP